MPAARQFVCELDELLPGWLLTKRHEAIFKEFSNTVEAHCKQTSAMGASRASVPRPSTACPHSISSLSLPPKPYCSTWMEAARWYHRTAGIFWTTYAVDLLLMCHMYIGAYASPHTC